MKNYVQRGDTLALTAPSDVLSGDVVIVGDLVGVASHKALSGDDVEATVSGVFDLPKANGALSQGSKAYWNTTNKNVVGTASGNTLIGLVTVVATSEASTVNVRLVG